MTEQELLRKADDFIEANMEDIIKDIKAVVDIPSVKSGAETGAPFGREIRRALDKALEIAGRMGFKTVNCEDYLGYAELPGQKEAYIGTIAHLDVVPAGNGWNTDPYDMVVKDGYLMGRGVVDNKGPLILTYYMGKFFKDLGNPLPYSLRMMAGCDEESGMEDVEYYIRHYEEPVFLFTPDSEFPLCNGEKGCLCGNFTSVRFKDGAILDFKGGMAHNAVADQACAVIRASLEQCPKADRITVTGVDGGVRIEAAGIGGHASHAEGTINAIGLIADYLLDNSLVTEEEEKFLKIVSLLCEDYQGHGLGIQCDDGIFPPLSIIGGMIRMEDGVLKQNFDSRYPTNTTGSDLVGKLSGLGARYGATVTDVEDSVPFYIGADKPEIKACLDADNEIRGVDGKPFTMGGGTYARHFKNAISFGTEIPAEPLPDFVGKIHTFDEGIGIDRLKMSLKIYILALYRLMQIEF